MEEGGSQTRRQLQTARSAHNLMIKPGPFLLASRRGYNSEFDDIGHGHTKPQSHNLRFWHAKTTSQQHDTYTTPANVSEQELSRE